MNAVDDYLDQLPDERRAALAHIRDLVHQGYPDAVEKISYNMPTFVVEGHAIGGFLSHQKFMSWYTHSGSTLTTLSSEISGRQQTKSSLHFTVAEPLPDGLIRLLLETRRREWSPSGQTD